jgi:ABC-type amino acid transport substrate-binding protein
MMFRAIITAFVFLNLVGFGQNKINFTTKEKDWIKEHSEILFAYDVDWQPISFTDENNIYKGIALDYLNLISEQTNLKFKPYPNITSWTESLERIKNKQVILIPALAKNKKRDNYIDFTEPYITYPHVIVNKKDGEFIGSLLDLKNKTIAMPKDFYSTDLVKSQNIGAHFIYKNGVNECLMAVSIGEADATIENLAVISHYLNYNGYENLKIACPADLPKNEIRMGVAKGNKLLLNILQKTLNNINQDYKNKIIQNWTSVKYEHGVNMKKIWTITAITTLIVLAIFGSFIYWNRKLKKQIKLRQLAEKKLQLSLNEISEQKDIIEHKNNEVTASITYAQRVQNAILPPFDYIFNVLNEAFVLFLPKDIVSGDFYYLETKDDGKKVFFSVSDCTGHGVPGAMVSMICYDTLHEAVMEQNFNQPSEILDFAKQSLISRFERSGKQIRDGMDTSFCFLNKSNLVLEWAGAYNQLWIIRDNKHIADSETITVSNSKAKIYNYKTHHHLIEVKADRQPVGKYEKSKPFTNHQIQLLKGDTIYISSDGYYDQFGGEDGRKMKTKTMRQLLVDLQPYSMIEQQIRLKEFYFNWKGNYDQIDDVCVFGVRV